MRENINGDRLILMHIHIGTDKSWKNYTKKIQYTREYCIPIHSLQVRLVLMCKFSRMYIMRIN